VPIPAKTCTVTLVVRPNQLPAQPAPLSPAAGEWLPITGAVRFVWAAVPRAAQYRVWIGKDGAAFTNEVTAGAATNLTVETLFHRGLYTWFVHGVNHLGMGPWSTTVTFRVERVMSPEGGLPAGSGAPVFRWTPTPGATAYRLAVEQYQLGSAAWAVLRTQSVTQAEWTPAGVAFTNGSYRWSLQEEREAVWQATEPARYFQLGVPAQPAPLAPAGTIYKYKAVPFFWTTASNAVSYQVQVMKGTAVYSNSVWLANTQLTVKLATTAAAYTWRVRAMNPSGTGAWSPVAALAFKTLAAPKPVAPVKGAAVSTKPLFQWKASPGAEGYAITAVNTVTKVAKTWKAGAVTQFQPPTALAKGSYTWTIKATNSDQSSPASAAAAFTVR
jgi:hypothetical protein